MYNFLSTLSNVEVSSMKHKCVQVMCYFLIIIISTTWLFKVSAKHCDPWCESKLAMLQTICSYYLFTHHWAYFLDTSHVAMKPPKLWGISIRYCIGFIYFCFAGSGIALAIYEIWLPASTRTKFPYLNYIRIYHEGRKEDNL